MRDAGIGKVQLARQLGVDEKKLAPARSSLWIEAVAHRRSGQFAGTTLDN